MTRCHSCDDPFLAEAEEGVCRQLVRPLIFGRALDVGAGTSGAGRRILKGWDYTGWDLYCPEHVQVDITGKGIGTYFGRPWFDLILCKRALCQMTDAEVSRAVSNMYDLLRPGGHLLVCEPWRAERLRLLELRSLPTPASGGEGVPLSPFSVECADLNLLFDIPVAPDYVLWTRYFVPSLLAPISVPKDRPLWDYSDPRRFLYPAFPPDVQNRYAFYRARLFRKRQP